MNRNFVKYSDYWPLSFCDTTNSNDCAVNSPTNRSISTLTQHENAESAALLITSTELCYDTYNNLTDMKCIEL